MAGPKECARALSMAQPCNFRGRGYCQVTSEPPAGLTRCRAARPEGESPPAAFKGSTSALRGGLLSRLRPLCPGLGSTGGSGWTLRGCQADAAQALGGPRFNWKFMLTWGVTCFTCAQRAAPLRCAMGTRSVALHGYFVSDGSFLSNSYKDSLARRERLLKARLAWIFKTPNIFFFSAVPLDMWDLSSLTRDWTRAPYSGNVES